MKEIQQTDEMMGDDPPKAALTLAEQIMAQARKTAQTVSKKSTQAAGFKEKKASPPIGIKEPTFA